jgi:hypothetical protein
LPWSAYSQQNLSPVLSEERGHRTLALPEEELVACPPGEKLLHEQVEDASRKPGKIGTLRDNLLDLEDLIRRKGLL